MWTTHSSQLNPLSLVQAPCPYHRVPSLTHQSRGQIRLMSFLPPHAEITCLRGIAQIWMKHNCTAILVPQSYVPRVPCTTHSVYDGEREYTCVAVHRHRGDEQKESEHDCVCSKSGNRSPDLGCTEHLISVFFRLKNLDKFI